jgi:hypothetical protein
MVLLGTGGPASPLGAGDNALASNWQPPERGRATPDKYVMPNARSGELLVGFQKLDTAVTWMNEVTHAARMIMRRVVASALSDLRPSARLAVVARPVLGAEEC